MDDLLKAPLEEDPIALMREAAEALTEAARLIEGGDLAGAGEAEALARRLAQKALRQAEAAAVRSSSSWSLSARPATLSRREVVLQALAELGRPSPAVLVASYAEARFGERMGPSDFASLRRDERKAWKSPRAARAAYIVPVLDAAKWEPHRGLVASSAWEPWVRFVGPRSRRVDQLVTTTNIARQVQWLSEVDPEVASRLARLMGQAAASIPGVPPRSTGEPEVVIRAASAELAHLQDEDEHLRREAAAAAARQLEAEQLLFGVG
jgi:hypothetical protein